MSAHLPVVPLLWRGRNRSRVKSCVKKRATRCFAVAIPLAAAIAAGADVLSGRISSASGEALPVAEVRLICGSEVVTGYALAGDFSVEGAGEAASCRLEVSAPGHATRTMSVAQFIADGKVLSLRSAAASRVEEVIVAADRISRPFAALYTPALATLANPSARADPLRAVATTPHSSSVGESPALRLRGSPANMVGLFVGEVPLYESVRGVGLEGRSLTPSALGSGLPYDAEVYPNNPPLYLTNAGVAAVRLMPSTTVGSSLALLTTGIAGTHTLARGDASVHAAGSWSNMGAMLALHPSLARTVSHSRSATANLRLSAKAGRGEVQALLLSDHEDGGYPIAVLSSRGLWRNERRRHFTAGSWQRSAGAAALKLNAGAMRSDGSGSYRTFRFSSVNDYRFLSLDASSNLLDANIRYRAGLAMENLRLAHAGVSQQFEPLWQSDFPLGLPVRRIRRSAHGGVYGYGTWQVSKRTMLMGGVRRHFGDGVSGEHSWQLGATREGWQRNGGVTVAAGEYHALRMPGPSEWHAPVPFRSRQVALDGRLSTASADFTVGAFLARIREASRRVTLRGIDLSMVWQIGNLATARASAIRARQLVAAHGRRFRGEGDVKFLLRAGLELALGGGTVTVSYVHGSGRPYAEVVGRTPSAVDSSTYLPVFGQAMSELGAYQRLDASVAVPMRVGGTNALGLLAVSNALDRANPMARAYSEDFGTSRDVHFPPRVFVAGLVLLF